MADPFSFAIATVAQIGISFAFPAQGPRIKDMRISASTYGASIPWVFGLCRVPGNMIWGNEPVEHKKKKWQGKGGFYNQYTYTCTFAMGLCKGPIKSISRIWADSKLIYDTTGTQAGSTVNNSKYNMRFYYGDEAQLPDSAIIAAKGEDNAPAFRGMAYIVFDSMLLSDFGDRIPQITVEVYAGPTEDQVLAIPFKQSDNTTPISTDYATSEGAFDSERNVAWLRYSNELSAINLSTQDEMTRFTSANFNFPDGDALANLFCTGRDSSVYVSYGPIASYMPIAKLDPYSAQAVLTFGSTDQSTGSGNLTDQFVAPVAIATAYSDQSVEYLLSIGTHGEVGMLRCSTMAYQWGADSYIGNAASTGKSFRVVGTDADSSGNPTFFVMWGDSSTIKLTKINGSTQTDVQTISGSGLVINSLLYDSSVAGLILLWSQGSTHYISKWSLDTNSEAWRITVPGIPVLMSGQSRVLSGRLAWVTGGRMYVISTATGAWDDSSIDAASGTVTPGTGEGFALPTAYTGENSDLQFFDSSRNMLSCFGGIEGAVYLSTATTGVTVGTIVDRLLQEGGMDRTQYDLTAIDTLPIRGYGWASGTDVKSIIEEMQRLFLFDLVETQGVLTAVLRGDLGTVNGTLTIPQNVLGSTSDTATDFWNETRAQEPEIPGSVQLSYMNASDDYQTSVARSQRVANPIPTMFSRQQLAIEANIVLTPTEAKAQTRAILYSQWAERVQHSSRLPWAYLDLDPADVIYVNLNDGRNYKDRLQFTEVGADYAIAIKTYSQDEGAYDGWTGISADGGGSGSQTLSTPGIAVAFLFNTPLLRDQDDTGGSVSRYYSGIGSGSGNNFSGGGLYRAVNNIDYSLLGGADSAIEWGTVIGTMPAPPTSPFALDWKTKLTILPATSVFELESITDDELWAGGNPCIVGNEVIQFRDCEENADGTWAIWNLLRGRRGTEYACFNHVAGERFVFLDNTTIGLQADTTNSRGQARYFKGVASGRSLADAAVTQISYEPRDLMPYAPVQIMREFTTSDDIDIMWSRRTRLGGNMMDGTGEVALSERTEAYTIYILNGAFSGDLSRGVAPANSRRSYTTTTPSVTYSASEQAADGFNKSTDTLYLAIYQLSDAVGLGFPGVAAITPDQTFEVVSG